MKAWAGVVFGVAGVLAAAPAQAAQVDPMELVQPVADYKVYITDEVGQLVAATRGFTDAIKAGKLAEARRLYAPTRVHYERIEPAAELFSDLDKSIDARADDYELREKDAEFTGFHRLEYGLFAQNATDGLAPFADKLMADVLDLQARLAGLAIPPSVMVGGAAGLIEEVAATKISGEEDRYSGTDLWDFNANLAGARKIVALVHPLTVKADAALAEKIDDNLASVETVLKKYATADGGFTHYDQLSSADRTALQGPITTLAEDLSRLRGSFGLD